MKLYFTAALFFISTVCFSQERNQVEPNAIDSGKNEFKLQATKDSSDYSRALRILTNQVKQNPKNAEYRYYLGYTLDRLNADDGRQMFQQKKELTIKASEQFEEVNKIEPIYKGELFLLDPYSKIGCIWGSLAEAYLNKKLLDSAKWAFSEGKKRGGFLESILEYNRQLLNSCEKNAILVTYGDNITIPIWYLQTIENLRNDITVVDANLINTNWYPKYLKSERKLKMSLSDADIENLDYLEWQSQPVSVINPINNKQIISWELGPTYLDRYILKGDRVLLDVFQQNYFQRPFYFNRNSDSSYNLYLSSYFENEGLVDRVSISNNSDESSNSVKVSANLYGYNIEKVKKEDIAKSRDAIYL
jgi:hypothetical protein